MLQSLRAQSGWGQSWTPIHIHGSARLMRRPEHSSPRSTTLTKGKNRNGISLNSDATIRRYFEPGLAGLIIKDRKDAADRGEAPTLSSDPFVGSSENPKLGVVVGMLMGGKGVAKRRRENFEFTSLKLTPHTLIKEVKRQWLWQQQNRVGGIFTSFATPATRRF